MKILSTLLLIIFLSSFINANDQDNVVKKQCQYLTYGNGNHSDVTDIYLLGIVTGMMDGLSSLDWTDFAIHATYPVIKENACKNALDNRSERGFYSDFMWEMKKLISKKYSKADF